MSTVLALYRCTVSPTLSFGGATFANSWLSFDISQVAELAAFKVALADGANTVIARTIQQIQLPAMRDDLDIYTIPNDNPIQIPGPRGLSVVAAAIVAGRFRFTLSDASVIDGGPVPASTTPGPTGLGVANIQINGSNHLIVTMTDGSTIDAGILPSGGSSTPAPTWSADPTITDDGTPVAGELLTGHDGTVVNGTISSRAWLLAGSVIPGAISVTYTPVIAGDYKYRVTASGAGGGASRDSAPTTVAPAPTPTPTPSTAIAPVLEVAVANNVWPPVILAHLGESIQTGDSIRLEYSHDATFATGVTTVNRTAADVPTISFALSGISAGTNRFRDSVYRAGVLISGLSALVTHGPDDLAPVLSAPTGVKTGTTTGTIGVTTDTDEGTIYFVLVITNSAPSKAQIKAGQNAAGTTASKAATISPNTTGVKTVGVTGLTQNTQYYMFCMHEDATGNQSNVPASINFTTDAAPVFSAIEVAAPAIVTAYDHSVTNDYTFVGVALGAADSTRELYICVEYDNGGGFLAGLEVGAVDAGTTHIADAFFSTNGWVFRVSYPTGTTADIKIKSASILAHVGIKVWAVLGGGTPSIVSNSGTYDETPAVLSGSNPAGGATIVFAGQVEINTPTWTGPTAASTTQGGGWTFMSAKRTAAGAFSSSLAGFTHYIQSYMHLIEIPPA